MNSNPFASSSLVHDTSFENLTSFCKIIQFLLSTDNNRKQELLNTLSYSTKTFLPFLWDSMYKRVDQWKHEGNNLM